MSEKVEVTIEGARLEADAALRSVLSGGSYGFSLESVVDSPDEGLEKGQRRITLSWSRQG